MQESGGEAPSQRRPASASQLSPQQLQELAQVTDWVLNRPMAEVRRLGMWEYHDLPTLLTCCGVPSGPVPSVAALPESCSPPALWCRCM